MFAQFLHTCKVALNDLDVSTTPSTKIQARLEPLLTSLRYELNDATLDLGQVFEEHVDEEITYISLLDETKLKVGIFVIPPGDRIPFHDHPGMCVISRVLYGELTISSIDWNSSAKPSALNQTGGQGQVTDVRTLRPPDSHVLYPDKCNIHELRAGSNSVCAVLDVITPDYDSKRPCTYYDILTTMRDCHVGPNSLAPGQPVVLLPKETSD